MRIPYSQALNSAQVMLSGIRANQTVLAERKIDEAFSDNLRNLIDLCVILNSEQEQAKARLKAKTQELNSRLAELKARTAEARKIVKMDIPQAEWIEFGINNKR